MSAESFATDLNHQLEHSAAIRKFAYEKFIGEHAGEFGRADYIAVILFNRCLQTHEATEILARRSFIDDAWVLVRALVEYAVNCLYMMMVADAQTAEDFVDLPKYKRYDNLKRLKRTNENLLRQSYSEEEEEELRQEFDAVSSRFHKKDGDKWCADHNISKRAAKVDEKDWSGDTREAQLLAVARRLSMATREHLRSRNGRCPR
ncbi:MAG TPA: DUF5677 domain-containing protein [Candidatus Dormibacteraeota bacterium]|nr:DUF5677 domain-containing protein [Candidatus Dormibacteraeota bacterium]